MQRANGLELTCGGVELTHAAACDSSDAALIQNYPIVHPLQSRLQLESRFAGDIITPPTSRQRIVCFMTYQSTNLIRTGCETFECLRLPAFGACLPQAGVQRLVRPQPDLMNVSHLEKEAHY